MLVEAYARLGHLEDGLASLEAAQFVELTSR
jgi:hypothetical protein